MIYIVGTFTAFFLALIILTKKGRTTADFILGIWMIVVGIHIFSYYGFIDQFIYDYPIFLGVNFPLPFLHGPLLYLYTLALTRPEKFQKKQWLWHLALPFVTIGIYSPFWFLTTAQKIEVFKHSGKGFETQLHLIDILLTCSGILYVLSTNLLLKKHRKRILHQFSNQDKINLHWLQFLFYAMGLIWALIIGNQDDQLIFSSASIFAVSVGYFGIKQVGIFTNQYPAAIASNTPLIFPLSHEKTNLEKKKYAKSGLNEESAQELHQRLSARMKQEKTFKDPELTLVDLASQLDIHPNYLSQIINDIEGVHFYDYINNLRIAEFKKMVILPENQRFTILALAYECGFNSKSSFNRCFKKTTQLSPSEFMKQALEMS